MTGSFTVLDVIVALVGIYLVQALLVRSKRRFPLPPGPRGLPFIGNVLDMPKELEWIKFSEWNDQHGSIVHLNIFGQSMVILGSYKDAVALLDKRSTIYSDRPTLVMAGELVGWDQTLSLLPYGDRLRERRRLAHKLFGTRSLVQQYHGVEEHETRKFLRRVLKSPGDLEQHIRKTAGAIVLKLIYGYEVQEGDDPLVNVVDHAVAQFSDAVAPGAFLVDVMPWLRYIPAWMPGAGFLRTAREWYRTLQEMVNMPHELVKKRMDDGTNIPNFTSKLLQDATLDDEKEEDIKWTAASLYAGCADTTVSAIHSFFLAMTIHPEVLKRAQAEIDYVIGTDRMPSLSDRPNLPYIEAVVKEVLRWNPVGPLGVPHRLTEDDIYEGYLIPKGSIVIANLWRMLHDPESYGPNPLAFDPSRHLGAHPAPDPKDSCFGFGRRICPGMLLADGSVWISCAMAIAAFDISKVEENGKVVEPEVAYTSGTISHPKPFKCNIRPRSEKAEALILAVDEQ